MTHAQFTTLFRDLHAKLMSHEFIRANPLITQIHPSLTDVERALCQYVRLPEEIVSYLETAANWFPQDHPVRQELTRNAGQESGSETAGVPHVTILKLRLQKDLAIDASSVQSNAATSRLLRTVSDGMKRSAWFAVGQAYALEASAIPELVQLVAPAINLCARLKSAPPLIELASLTHARSEVLFPTLSTREDALNLSMTQWFAMHTLDFEVGHRDLLQEAIRASLSDESVAEFTAGFSSVLCVMDLWWRGIHLPA